MIATYKYVDPTGGFSAVGFIDKPSIEFKLEKVTLH